MRERRIYLDNAATTRPDPRVLESMSLFMHESFGNPSSLHHDGRESALAVEVARGQVAGLISADPSEIFFTSSGTESDNLALIGSALALHKESIRIAVSGFEHAAILEPCRYLNELGFEIVQIQPNKDGIIEPEGFQKQIEGADIVSVMTANNVIGTIQPIEALAKIAKNRGALFHSDAVQAVGKIPLDLSSIPVDLLSLSAHKLHGPKGIGAIYIRKGTRIKPLLYGGGQEKEIRPSTENVPSIVGFGRACEISKAEMAMEGKRLSELRDLILENILAKIPNSYLIGDKSQRLPGHLCLGFSGMEGEAISLLLALDQKGVSVSSGSACSSNHAGHPSQALLAMGFDPVRARGSLRISLGRFNTTEEAMELIQILPLTVSGLRKISSR